MTDIYTMANELSVARAEIERLRTTLTQLRRQHYICEDGWYSCPKSEGGCLDPDQGNECNCGADQHNAIIDAALGVTNVQPFNKPKEEL